MEWIRGCFRHLGGYGNPFAPMCHRKCRAAGNGFASGLPGGCELPTAAA